MTSVFFLLSLGCAGALHLRTKGESAKWKEAKKPIFYMTAMGKLASKHQTRLWLSSIRNVGKYDGEVVMVTDQAGCLAKNLVGLLGEKIQDKSNEAVDVYSGGETCTEKTEKTEKKCTQKGNVYMVKVKSTTNIKEMKSQKAKAWTNIRAAGLKPRYIVHTDQDIVFGSELKAFLQNVDVLEVTDATPLLALFVDQGVTKGQLHTGIVVMFPGNKTETCLNDWGAKILTTHSTKYKGLKESQEEIAEWKDKKSASVDKKSASVDHVTAHGDFDGLMTEEAGAKIEAELLGPDQRALACTASCRPKGGNPGIVKMPAQYLLMPTKGSLNKGARAAFIHFTNTNRWKSIKAPDMQKYFTSVLGLEDNMDFFKYEEC